MLTAGAALVFSLLYALGVGLILLALRLRGRGFAFRRVGKVAAAAFIPLLAGLIFLLLPVIFSHLLAAAGTRPQDQVLTSTPASHGRQYREVEFTASDGVRLSGWYLQGEEKRVAFVMSHGLFRNRQELLERAALLNAAGHSVLLFDLRNHGTSGGSLVTLGYQEKLDILAASRFVEEETNHRRLVLFGVSMGAVAAIHSAPLLARGVQAVVADSPFLSLSDTVARHTKLFMGLPAFPFSRIFTWNLTRLAGFQAGELDCEAALKRLQSTPVLLIFGQNDPRMPEEAGRRLFAAIPHERKQIVVFEGAGHGDAFHVDSTRYIEVVLRFCAVLEGTTPPAMKWRTMPS